MVGTSSGFADGRHEDSPDSEQMEQAATVLLLRNSGSMEQIQDRREEPSRLKTKKAPEGANFKKWRERRGCLDLFALNVSTDFLFRNFVSSKEKSSALCSQVARTIKQGFALRSSRLFIPQLLTKK